MNQKAWGMQFGVHKDLLKKMRICCNTLNDIIFKKLAIKQLIDVFNHSNGSVIALERVRKKKLINVSN